MSEDLRKNIENLRKQLASQEEALHNTERNCKHNFDEAKYDAEEYQKSTFSHYEPCGSDPYPVHTFSKAFKERWSRTCLKCGKKEYTYTKKPTQYKPDFGDNR